MSDSKPNNASQVDLGNLEMGFQSAGMDAKMSTTLSRFEHDYGGADTPFSGSKSSRQESKTSEHVMFYR